VASYHFSAQIVKRSERRSSVRCAAYRSGAKLVDERTGQDADFSRRRGVAHTEIMAPDGSAAWLRDRQALWNAVERMEKRTDAQLAREINVALPAELTAGQRLDLVRQFVASHLVNRGMVADIAIHSPVAEKGDDPRNHHAHIMLTLRQATKHGLRPVKTREWNSDILLKQWRRAWAEHQNAALRAHGHHARVDHRTLVAQRQSAHQRGDVAAAEALDRLPELHVGPRATSAARRGVALQSRTRDRGRLKQEQGRAPGRRKIHYQEIDTGSRYQANRQRIERNLAAIDRKIVYWMERTARERARHQHQLRRILGTRMIGYRGTPGVTTGLRSDPVLRQIETILAKLFQQRRRAASRHLRLARPFNRSRGGSSRLGRHRSRMRR
jgi:hypothetical protein